MYLTPVTVSYVYALLFFFFQAEDGIRDLVRSRGLGDVYKRQLEGIAGAGRLDRSLGKHVLDGTECLLGRVTVVDLSLIHI